MNFFSTETILFQYKKLREFLFSMWQNASVFFLIDLLFAAITAIIIYLFSVVSSYVLNKWIIVPEYLINDSLYRFCLIYFVAIAVISIWWHIRFVFRYKPSENKNNSSEQKKN